MRNPDPVSADLSIGQVARESGFAASAIRYYEAEGVLPEPDRQGGKRRYPRTTLARLDLIRTVQHAGFSLDEIKVVLSAVDGGPKRGKAAFQKLARAKLPEVEEGLRRQKLIHTLLSASLTCGCPDLTTCTKAAQKAGLLPQERRPKERKPRRPPR